MSARSEDAEAPARSRRPGSVGHAVVQGLFLLAGLATTVLAFSWFLDANAVARAYREAPVCGSAAHAPGADCVVREPGKVTDRYTVDGDGTSHQVVVARGTGAEQDFLVLPRFYAAVKVGTDVDVTLFRGRVAGITYQGQHATNPGTPWSASLKVAIPVLFGTALTVMGLTWARTRRNGAVFAFVIAGFTASFAFLGCLGLIPEQLPPVALLAGPVAVWLFMTACGALVLHDD
ncbi:hypothetical protein ACFCX4_35605 [Kitasatospora sp. NPDC056327]|uniref:hypothetical protein n=1 Tax=Kitasatospora sp. NPDC056327 TaxID=3345785 RepID=UPI0035D72F37